MHGMQRATEIQKIRLIWLALIHLTFDAAILLHGRISKVRARHPLWNYAGYNYERGQWVPIGDARPASGLQKGGSQHPPGPRILAAAGVQRRAERRPRTHRRRARRSMCESAQNCVFMMFTAGISTIVVWPPGLTDGIGAGALSLPSS